MKIPPWPAPEPDEALLPAPINRFDLFRATLLLLRSFPGAPLPGGREPADQERLRYHVSTDLRFPVADLERAELRRDVDGVERVHLTTRFFGLHGSDSPLPPTYTEEILHSEEDHPSLPAFLDVFHHRFLALFFRSWHEARAQQRFREGADDPLSRTLLSLLGTTPEAVTEQTGLAPERLLRTLSLFLLPNRPARGLELLLADALNVPVRVLPGLVRKLALESDDRYRLGRHGEHRVGRNVVVGRSQWERNQTVQLEVGPVSPGQLEPLLPGGKAHLLAIRLTRFYLQHPHPVRLELVVPASALEGLKLGWTEASGAARSFGTRLRRVAPLRQAVTDPVRLIYTYEHDQLPPGASARETRDG